MSEKRFKAVDGGFKHIIEDKEQRRIYLMHIYEHNQKVVDLLNELVTKCNQLEMEKDDLEKEKEGWKLSTCQYMNKDSVLMMDCQIVHEALFELEGLIEEDTEQKKKFNDLKEKFKSLVNHYLGVLDDE